MEERIETAVEHVNDVAVIRVAGDLTAAAQEQLETAYATASASAGAGVVLAFCESDHINSAGIGLLIGLVMEARKAGQAMRLVHPSEHFRKIFDIVGLSRYVQVHASVDEALADLG